MRHIFFVQSNLSALVCQAIIARRGIDASDVVFLLNRGIRGPSGFQSFTVSRNIRFSFSKRISKVVANWITRKRAEKELAMFTQGKEFEFYVNRMNYEFIDVAQSLAGFKSLNLYEEGLAAYHRELVSSAAPVDGLLKRLQLNLLKRLSGYRRPGPRRTFYSDSYKSVFATSERAFENFPRREIVDLEAVVRDLADKEDYPEVPADSIVCILPLPYDFLNDIDSRNRFLDALTEVMGNSGSRSVVFKSHPDVDEHSEFWNEFFGELARRTGLDIGSRMRPDLHLESLAISRKDIVFCIGVSSFGAYARMLSIKLISFAPLVLGENHPKVAMLRRVSEGLLFWEEPNQFPELLLAVCGSGRSKN